LANHSQCLHPTVVLAHSPLQENYKEMKSGSTLHLLADNRMITESPWTFHMNTSTSMYCEPDVGFNDNIALSRCCRITFFWLNCLEAVLEAPRHCLQVTASACSCALTTQRLQGEIHSYLTQQSTRGVAAGVRQHADCSRTSSGNEIDRTP
jgi:hypothetical protein